MVDSKLSMKKHFSVTLFLITSVVISQATEIANLHNDFTSTKSGAQRIGTSTHRPQGWTFYHGYPAQSELTFSKTLGVANRKGIGYGGDSLLETPLISSEAIFDAETINPNELCFHSAEGNGPTAFLHIRWTAKKDYPEGLSIDYTLTKPGKGSCGFLFGVNSATRLTSVATNYDTAAGFIDALNHSNLASIAKGDTLEFVLTNQDGHFAGDQTFGNFVIHDRNHKPSENEPLLSIDFQGIKNQRTPIGFLPIQAGSGNSFVNFDTNSTLRVSRNGVTFSFTSGKAMSFTQQGNHPIKSDAFCFNIPDTTPSLGFKVSGLRPNSAYEFELISGMDGDRMIGLKDGNESLIINNKDTSGKIIFHSNSSGIITGEFTSANTEANLGGLTITAVNAAQNTVTAENSNIAKPSDYSSTVEDTPTILSVGGLRLMITGE